MKGCWYAFLCLRMLKVFKIHCNVNWVKNFVYNELNFELKYRTSNKNSALLIIRHPLLDD